MFLRLKNVETLIFFKIKKFIILTTIIIKFNFKYPIIKDFLSI